MRKFNVLDTIFILVIVVCIIGACYRFMGGSTTFRDTNHTFDYVIKVESLRIYSRDALIKSAKDNSRITDTSKKTDVGYVYDVKYKPARESMQLADGSIKWVDLDNRYDVYVYVRTAGEITPQSFVAKSGTEVLMNRENYYTTRWSGFFGRVLDVGKDLSTVNYDE